MFVNTQLRETDDTAVVVCPRVFLSVFFNQNICWYPVRVHSRFMRVRFFSRRTNYKELITLV